ncbi:MAG: cohesin domain-containing protein [bacterium]|nr:cohesin domain-containing protein [bacterium]
MRRFKFLISIISISVLFILNSCGKSGGGSSMPLTGTGDTISFTPSGTPSDNTVYLEQVSINNDEINLAVKVKNGTDVYGAAIEITYDSSKINYISLRKGDYLGTEGDIVFSAMLDRGKEGTLLVGSDKKGDVPGANGDGTLVTIVFRALTTQANTAIGFNVQNSALKSSNAHNPNIAGTSWIGGSLNYQ